MRTLGEGKNMWGVRKVVSKAVLLASPSCFLVPCPVQAQDDSSIATEVFALREELDAQRELIEEQAHIIAAQQAQIDALYREAGVDLGTIRGTGTPAQPDLVEAPLPAPERDIAPVGVAPPEAELRTLVPAVPQEQGVLTASGRLVLEPSLEYTRSSSNRLVFRGFELVPGIQIGLIEATDADRDTLVATASFRHGVTNRLEIDGRLPYVYRNDRIEVVQQRDEGIVRSVHLQGDGLGDLELGLRYQLNDAAPLRPIWVASVRVKSDTGNGPFDVDYDEFGVATGLSTGSGFWAVQPGISFLLPSDPAVIYGGATYIYQIDKNIDRVIGGALVGNVDPGDAVSANVGFGFALNPRFSYSLGYRHHYIFKTISEIADTIQKSSTLQIGSLAFGMSYRVTAKQVVNLGFEFGVTEDAPDVSLSLRVPIAPQ